MRRAACVLALAALAATAPPAAAKTIRGTVAWVSDGDTVIVRAGGSEIDVRLLGIDTPETKKPGVAVECGGREATSRMWRLTFTAPYDADGDGRLRPARRERPPDRPAHRPDAAALRPLRPAARLRHGRRAVAAGADDRVRLGDHVPARLDAFRKRDRFLALEKGAKRAGCGVYGKCGGDFHSRQ